jgi:hypothetical protein
MAERMPGKPGAPRAIPLGLVAGFVTFALAACGQGNSPTAVSAGPCHVVCGDYSSLHVAIAVSPSSLVCGTAANLDTLEEAKSQSVAACGRSDCVPVIWGHGGVASVAVNRVAYGWGWAQGASSTADAMAIASCESRTP